VNAQVPGTPDAHEDATQIGASPPVQSASSKQKRQPSRSEPDGTRPHQWPPALIDGHASILHDVHPAARRVTRVAVHRPVAPADRIGDVGAPDRHRRARARSMAEAAHSRAVCARRAVERRAAVGARVGEGRVSHPAGVVAHASVASRGVAQASCVARASVANGGVEPASRVARACIANRRVERRPVGRMHGVSRRHRERETASTGCVNPDGLVMPRVCCACARPPVGTRTVPA
jgi:hypothetical protein